MEARIRPRRYFAIKVKRLLFFLDKICTHIVRRACAESVVCGISGQCLLLEAEMWPKFTLFAK
jgi:hypothetical protein